jgi:hypothetical protein
LLFASAKLGLKNRMAKLFDVFFYLGSFLNMFFAVNVVVSMTFWVVVS